MRVRGQWAYPYLAVDKHGDTIDFHLSPTRNTAAAKRFPGKALNGPRDWEKPRVINTDKAPTRAAALAEPRKEGKCPEETLHRQVKCPNNVVEADHGKLKVMRALRKGQASAFNITDDIRGEARIVERAFGLGPWALAEAIQLIGGRLDLAAA